MRCGSVRDEKLLCAECAGVPELAVHKYSGQYRKGQFFLNDICLSNKPNKIAHGRWTVYKTQFAE